MKHTFKFKSLPIVTDPSGETREIKYSMESARDHSMEFRMREFLLCRSWILNFFISLMAVIMVSAFIYGVLIIGLKADMSSGSTPRILFLLFMALSFIALLLSLGIPSAIKRLKMEFVIKERGQDNWKIVNDRDWDHFRRLIKIAEDRKKSIVREARKRALEE
jgi:hypothetical protein